MNFRKIARLIVVIRFQQQCKTVRMMEIRWSRRMAQCPVRAPAFCGFDDRSHRQPPVGASGRCRPFGKSHGCLQYKSLGIGTQQDRWRLVRLYSLHTGSIRLETINGPLHRRREIEFVVTRLPRFRQKGFTTGVLPQSIPAPWYARIRQNNAGQITFDRVFQREPSLSRYTHLRRKLPNVRTRRIRMTSQSKFR